MRRLIASASCMAAAVLVLAGCASVTSGTPHGGGGGSGSFPAPSSQSAGPSQSAPSAGPSASGFPSAPGSSAAGGFTQTQAQAALLTPAQVGAGFVIAQAEADTDPLPCDPQGSAPLDVRVPPAAEAKAEYDHGSDVALEEDVLGYADVATADRAYAAGMAGFSCTSGTLYNDDGTTSPVTISDQTDAGSALGVENATAWTIMTSQLEGGIVIAQFGARVVALTFVATSSADTGSLPDSETISKAAIAKVQSVG
jgi:hypothetical protein